MMLLLALSPAALAEAPCDALSPALERLDAHPHCLTVPLGVLQELATTPALRTCADQALALRGLPALPPRQAVLPAEPPPPDGEKELRDAYNLPSVYVSENVAVRWGDGVSEALAAEIAEAFEWSWSVELDQMAYPLPAGLDRYHLNVYIADTGHGAPSAERAAGYYTRDRQGHPMIVLSLPTAQDVADNGRTTIAHEFFHALQDATDGYNYVGLGAWYFEATASWIEVEVYPDALNYAEVLFGFSFFPHLPLNYFDYPDEGTLVEFHQYGAFIFPLYLSEHVSDWEIIRRSWMEAGDEPDPLVVIDGLLQADHGLTLPEAFADFATRNATWDYDHGEWYAIYHDAVEDYYPRDSYRKTMRHIGDSGGVRSPPEELFPQRFGANYVVLEDPEGGPDLRVTFEGDAVGTEGSEARWALSLSAYFGEDVVVEVLSLPLPEEGLVVEGFGEADEVWMTVANNSDVLVEGEAFPYAYSLTPEGGVDDPDDSGLSQDTNLPEDPGARACGCSASPAPGALPWALMLLALGLSRRRR
ncbi:MAG: hypothetical protein H6741_32625 [Alphaproteobacteria bacterium]|nr:hypothetical protein [Alphaproteobacteria bacterium]MCB9797461.1 hypothetical protein [Alphaproteobacteria bacterium]